jgi:hypothetical protein
MASSSQVPHIPTELAKFHQTIKKAGVGAHHQNGVAERNIQTIMAMARTMMLHAAICWPETAEASLWPMAVNYAVHIHNHMPNRTSGLSPIDLFTRTRFPTHKCNDLQVWGCPTFVLDPRMQDGKKLPRWSPRSRRAQFVGLSKDHASTAPLVLNLDTGHISPQFHCVFDCWFTTVIGDPAAAPKDDDPIWEHLFTTNRYHHFFDDYEPPDPTAWEHMRTRSDIVRRAQDHYTYGSISPESSFTAPPPTAVLDPVPSPLAPPVTSTRSAHIDGRKIRFPEDSVLPTSNSPPKKNEYLYSLSN